MQGRVVLVGAVLAILVGTIGAVRAEPRETVWRARVTEQHPNLLGDGGYPDLVGLTVHIFVSWDSVMCEDRGIGWEPEVALFDSRFNFINNWQAADFYTVCGPEWRFGDSLMQGTIDETEGTFTLSPRPYGMEWDWGDWFPITGLLDELIFAGTPRFRRGDCNQDGIFDIVDPIRLLVELFADTDGRFFTSRWCFDACDANDDGALDLADAVTSLRTLFVSGGGPLPPPYGECGEDPTVDDLTCQGYGWSEYPCVGAAGGGGDAA